MEEIQAARWPSGSASLGLGSECSGRLPGRGDSSAGQGGGDSERRLERGRRYMIRQHQSPGRAELAPDERSGGEEPDP